jgi:hypothetical protein
VSKRRKPGELVVRQAGSGFLGSEEPRIIQVPFEPKFGFYDTLDSEGEATPCMLCDDPDCREWANLRVIGGPHDGRFLCHISECEMEDFNVEPA